MEVAVGGGFGARSKVCEQEAICALLALETGRPVRLVYTRGGGVAAAQSRRAQTGTPRPGDVTPCGWKITTCGRADCLRAAAAAIDWKAKRRERVPYRGVGLAAVIH